MPLTACLLNTAGGVGNGPTSEISVGAVTLPISALLLAAFPLVRPFGDRSPNPLVIAHAFASPSWVLAHILGGLGFLLLSVGLLGLYTFLQERDVEDRAFQGRILSWIGIGLILPTVLGTEAFGLRAIGQVALQQKNMDLLAIANSIRFGPQRMLFFPGLLLLGVGAIMTAVAVWNSGTLSKWSGIPFAIGLTLFFPLFPQAIRIIDGLLIGTGRIWVALSVLQRGNPPKLGTSSSQGFNKFVNRGRKMVVRLLAHRVDGGSSGR